MSKITVVLGAQWGDEGKGKLVDILGETHSVIVRSGGGANAGHTIVRDGKKYIFSLLPSAMIDEKNIGVIGNGCVVNLPSLKTEIINLEKTGVDLTGRILISSEAHLLFDFHKAIDEFQENAKGLDLIGTTKRGIGPCYSDKVSRVGIRAGDFKAGLDIFNKKFDAACDRVKDLYDIDIERDAEKKIYADLYAEISPYIIDASLYLEKAETEGKNILLEGAQAFMLDIDHGTYPFVTSS
ncbi:TPA: adenylosuccinate synthetase, partial [Candidatus Peregrinibacteria bacterium]|nr:adenylosuccinate synthetase [Candidatus Peregrinibacteria bacterium]